jgi:NADH-quinone oxidoreductase subunit E
MLTPEEKKEIDEEAAHYEQRSAAGIEALKIVQRREGWVSDESVREVADFLDMSFAELDGVATFYNHIFRKPVGRHVILVCDSISCWIMGYDELLERLREHLGVDIGKTTSDGRFTLLSHACLGICQHAPALMIDEDTYENVDPSGIDAILAKYS